MKKRLSALILAMLMILSICPVALAEDAAVAVGDAVIYDAHVSKSSNFVLGGTLTAEYSISPSNVDIDTEATKKNIKWYAMTRYGSPMPLGTGESFTIPEDYFTSGSEYYNSNGMGIYFTVTPVASDGTTEGNTFYSFFYNQPLNPSRSDVATYNLQPMNVAILPQNPEGTMNVGDTVVVRYTYRDKDKKAQGDTVIEWYTRASAESDRVSVGTGETYKIKEADYNKILEADVTLKNVEGTTGSTVTTMNHVGNLGFGKNVKISTTNMRNLGEAIMKSNLADGSSYSGNNQEKTISGCVLTQNANPTFIYDMGEITAISKIYLKNIAAVTAVNVYVSEDGETWPESPVKSFGELTAGTSNYLTLDKTLYSRYYKVAVTMAKDRSIADMYFLSGDTWVEYTNGFADVATGEIKVQAWKTPGSKIIENTQVASGTTKAIADSQGTEISQDFVVDENISGKYLKIMNSSNKYELYEIKYGGITGTAHDTAVDVGSSDGTKKNVTTNIPVVWSYPAVWHISAKIFAVPNQTVGATLTTGEKWNTAMHLENIVKFNADNTLTVSGAASGSSFKWVSGMWHDVDIVLDTGSIDVSKINDPIDIKVWIDGVSIPMNASASRLGSTKFALGDRLNFSIVSTGDGTQTTYGIPQAKEVSIRKVYDMNVFTLVNDAALNLKFGDEVVNDIEAGEAYTFENTMGIYKGESFANYLAVFDVTYDGETETSRVLNRVVKNPEKIDITAGQEVRAFCFSDTLVPLTKMGEWK